MLISSYIIFCISYIPVSKICSGLKPEQEYHYPINTCHRLQGCHTLCNDLRLCSILHLISSHLFFFITPCENASHKLPKRREPIPFCTVSITYRTCIQLSTCKSIISKWAYSLYICIIDIESAFGYQLIFCVLCVRNRFPHSGQYLIL